MYKPEEIPVRKCPFCGGKKVEIQETKNALGNFYVIECSNCWAVGPLANTERMAILLWNMEYKNE